MLRKLRKIDILLNRQTADVTDESPDQRFREPGIIQIQDVLNNVISKRILNEIERVEDDFSDELQSLRWRGMINRSLKDTTSVSVSGDFDQVGGDCIVDELIVFWDELVQAFLDDLKGKQASYFASSKSLTWLPLRSLIKATTFMDKA